MQLVQYDIFVSIIKILCLLFLVNMNCKFDQVKEDGMGRACGTNGGEEECI
jgi:hypothetical protein